MRRFLKEVGEYFSLDRTLGNIADITKFHRIQGSKELVEAAKYILKELWLSGIKAELLEDAYDGEKLHLTLKSPVAWDVIEGFVEINGKKLTTSKTPLTVMAHSPSGEAGGEVVLIESEDDWKNAKGKIVLAGKEWRENYEKANKNGAVGFIIYKKGSGKAVPYVGLFLTKRDLEWAKIPAVAISEEWAEEIIARLKKGEKVEAKIKTVTEIGEKQTLPMVYAEIGKAPYILFTAHICHPSPGANDNASGSGLLLEIARVLNNLYTEEFRFGFAFLWIPEYHGSQAFIEKFAKLEDYYVSINLDMVGGSEDRANSTLMLIKTPLSRFSIVNGLLEYFVNLLNSQGKSFGGEALPKLKFKAYSYEAGSDHDVLNFFGVPSLMLITWPDKYYHTSEDSLEKLSKDSLEIAGKSIVATVLALAMAEKNELKRFARGYIMKYLGELGLDRDIEVSEKLIMSGLLRDSKFLGINLGHELEPNPWLKWERRGIISVKAIKEINEEVAEELRRLFKDSKIHQVYELLMLGEVLSKEESFKALEEEFGKIEREKLERVLELLNRVGFVSFV